MVSTPLREGLRLRKDSIYKTTEIAFRESGGRTMVAMKGGSRPREYRCGQHGNGCGALARFTKQATGEFKCTRFVAVHTNCGGGTSTANIRGTSSLVEATLANDSNISGPKLKKVLQRGGAQMNLSTVQRAKLKLVRASQAVRDASYRKLPAYFRALEDGSPGTVTHLERDSTGRMTKCFVMSGKAVHVACQMTLKVASVDSGFLKGDYEGQGLMLSVKDDNDKILIVATAVADIENQESYLYLFNNCMRSEAFARHFNNESMTIFADGHKGSPGAVARALPRVQFRRCLHHILKNAPAVGSVCLPLVYRAARAPTKQQMLKELERVEKEKPLVRNHILNKVNPATWAHSAASQDTVVADTVTSNMAESAFNMVGAEVRAMPPLQMLEAIVDQTAEKCAANARTGLNTSETKTPFAVKTYEAELVWSENLHVKVYGSNTFRVIGGGMHAGSNTVDLEFKSADDGGHAMACTCHFPVRYQIPCCHVLAVAKHLNEMNRARELINGYSALNYRAAYDSPQFAIRPPALPTLDEDATLIPPVAVENKSGRPKGKRKRKRVTSNGELTPRRGTTTPCLRPLVEVPQLGEAGRASLPSRSHCRSRSRRRPLWTSS